MPTIVDDPPNSAAGSAATSGSSATIVNNAAANPKKLDGSVPTTTTNGEKTNGVDSPLSTAETSAPPPADGKITPDDSPSKPDNMDVDAVDVSDPVKVKCAYAKKPDQPSTTASTNGKSNGGKTQPSSANSSGAATADETAASPEKTAPARDVNSDFAVKVKSEYVLAERPSCLAPPMEPETNPDNNNDGKDDRNQSKRSKNNRGQNKKRPRDAKTAYGDKACLAVVRGRPCPFENSQRGCRYNHDLKQMLADRPDDIKEVEGGCPLFNIRGYCDFGIMCRLGSCHVNMSTGQNLCRTVDGDGKESTVPPSADEPNKENGKAENVRAEAEGNRTSEKKLKPEPGSVLGHQRDTVMNVLSKKTQIDLRKKKYPFICKRHFEVEKPRNNDGKNRNRAQGGNRPTEARGKNFPRKNSSAPPKVKATAPTSTTTPALPKKERKLIDFRNKVYIAPLTTVGNLPFRRIMKHYGADITCGEMALSDQLLIGKPSEWALLKRHPCEDVFGVQIASGHPDQYTRVAEVIANEPGFDVDFVDLNLGCPIDLVCERGAGASLMMRERKLQGSLEGLLNVLPCQVTIKMRTGWSEANPIAHQLVPKIQRWGIDGVGAVMIHGRSRLQRYSRLAKWDYIAQVASSQSTECPQIPVIGNGDIFSYTDYQEKILDQIEQSNADNLLPTAMLGRGALIKPWLPTEIKERRHWDISASERLDMLKDFVRFGLEHWGSDQQGVNQVRRFLLEWLSFLHRYVPVGLLEVIPQQMNHRPPNNMCGRSDLETLMLSKNCADWIKISEMLLGPVPEGFQFEPKHKANSYQKV